MGLINAITGSVSHSANNMFKGFYMCDSLSSNTLMKRGIRHTSSRDSVQGDPNVITNGSIISVADGQAAIVVCSGCVTSIFTEPGEHELKKGGNVSLFEKNGLSNTVDSAVKRIGFGGDYYSSQRLYFVNTKEIMGNPFSTAYPIPITINDIPGGNCMDVSVHIKGMYSMRITRPDILYKNVTGNVLQNYTVDQLSSQIRSELMSEMSSITAKLSDMNIYITELPSFAKEMGEVVMSLMNEYLEPLRGISITKIAISSFYVDTSDMKIVQQMQKLPIYAGLVSALHPETESGVGSGVESGVKSASETKAIRLPWTCACGKENTGHFCEECGAQGKLHWRCTCGKENLGKFCEECGTKYEE